MENKKYFIKLQITSLLMSFAILVIQIIGIIFLYHHERTLSYKIVLFCCSMTILCATAMISIYFANEGVSKEEKKKAYIDVTGIHNKRSCMEKIWYLESKNDTFDIGIAIFDLNNLKKVNDFYGHDKGDDLIKTFAQLLSITVDDNSFLARFGGDEFIIISENTAYNQMEEMIGKLNFLVEEHNKTSTVDLSFSAGFEISNREHYYLIEELIKEADKKMYENKRKMKSVLPKAEKIEKARFEAASKTDISKDSLLGLYSQDTFFKNVSEIISKNSEKKRFVFLCSDISNFRYVNENFGYRVGNVILKLFADEIKESSGIVSASRIFSDNFVSIMDITGRDDNDVVAQIKRRNAHITQRIQELYKGSYCTINTGLYFIKSACEIPEDIMNFSNTARKLAKNKFNSVQVYSEQIEQIERKRADILNNFHTALENEQLEVYLQPQISGQTGKICSAEALIRWKKEDGGVLSAYEFIPILEQTGDIVFLDYYVYRKMFQWLYKRKQLGMKLIPISMNVSRVHLNRVEELISHIKDLQKLYDISPEYLIFELTESAYIENVQKAGFMIKKLHELNVKVSMDDFGSGYSSLKALNSLAFDEIKIDKDFLSRGMTLDGKIVLQEIISLLKKLNKKIVCEGVEKEEEVLFLKNKQCDILQGYYFSKPIPITEFETLLEYDIKACSERMA